jgi:hypothetical protein
MKLVIKLIVGALFSVAHGHTHLRADPASSSLPHRLTQHAQPSFTSFIQLDELRSNARSSILLTKSSINDYSPADDVVVGSNVGQYGVDDKLNGVRLVVEKNTGFALPVKAVDAQHPCPAGATNPCEKELTPLEKKVKDAEAQVAALAKTRKIESETLESRIRREQEITDAAIEKQLTTQEKLSSEETKLEKIKHQLEQAEVAATKRKQLLVDPNRFTDSCSPGFRIYFNGEAKDRMTFDDKKVLAKGLKDRHCQDKDLLCMCDMAKKQNIKSILGKVNAGVDCQCYLGLSKQIREESMELALAEKEKAEQDEKDDASKAEDVEPL